MDDTFAKTKAEMEDVEAHLLILNASKGSEMGHKKCEGYGGLRKKQKVEGKATPNEQDVRAAVNVVAA